MKYLHLLFFSFLSFTSGLLAAPLPTSAVIATNDTYDLSGITRGKSYVLSLGGNFDTATVALQYFNPASSNWETLRSYTGAAPMPAGGLVHVAGGSVARLSVTGITGTAGITVQFYPIDPVTSTGAPGSASIVQELDGLLRSDTATGIATYYTQECTGYRSVAVQYTAIGTSVTMVAEISNDGTNWAQVLGYAPLNGGSTAPSATPLTGLGSITQFPTPARYFRLRSTAQTGSYTVQSFFRSEPIPKLALQIGNASGTNSVLTQGPAAAGATFAGNPTTVSFAAGTAAPSARTNGQVATGLSTVYGVQVTRPYSIPELDWSYVPPAGGLTNSATAVTLKAAAAAGIRNYVTSMNVSTDTLGSACDLVVLDGSTVIYRQRLQTTGIPQSVDIDFPTPLKGTAATALNIQTQVGGTAAAVTGGVYVNVQGYAAP